MGAPTMTMAVQPARQLNAACCIAGGGPAGLMAGFLLARSGVDVIVLEKHADFLRDFRGDTIHPSTLELMYELGLLEEFLKRPHTEIRRLKGMIGTQEIVMADFSHLSTHCRFLAFMPQWDFLDFLSAQAKGFANFRLMMTTQAHGLIVGDDGRVVGVRAEAEGGPIEIRAALTIGADGRDSVIRAAAGLEVEDLGAPMDVLWMRLSKRPDDPSETLGRIGAGRLFITLDRGDYWQCAFVIAKGAGEEWRAKGIAALRGAIASVAPEFRARVGELASFDDVELLTVKVDRLRKWHRPGLICIGDAAHAMSPVGGVGINLAVQDAVAAANILARPLKERNVSERDLHAVQERRMLAVRLTQAIQLVAQKRVIGRLLQSTTRPRLPFLFRLFNWFPVLRRIPARLIGVGVRPEHIHTPEA
jgi:2-polyprenyl-6-methoxyphenol hydroxylase-like FAD-dependent oxidoreductase